MSTFVRLQRVLPQHLISRALGRLAAAEAPWVRGPLIRAFARTYGVDMAEAERADLGGYASFNDFFYPVADRRRSARRPRPARRW